MELPNNQNNQDQPTASVPAAAVPDQQNEPNNEGHRQEIAAGRPIKPWKPRIVSLL